MLLFFFDFQPLKLRCFLTRKKLSHLHSTSDDERLDACVDGVYDVLPGVFDLYNYDISR